MFIGALLLAFLSGADLLFHCSHTVPLLLLFYNTREYKGAHMLSPDRCQTNQLRLSCAGAIYANASVVYVDGETSFAGNIADYKGGE